MGDRRAGDLMIPIDKYPHIPYWFTLREAVIVLEQSTLEMGGRSSLPRALLVFDESYQLVGIARRRDMLRGLEPRFLGPTQVHHPKKMYEMDFDPNLVDLSANHVVDEMRERGRQPVSEVMQPISAILDFNDNLAKIIFTLVSRDMHLVPVMKGDEVVGVVRSVDVFSEVARMIE